MRKGGFKMIAYTIHEPFKPARQIAVRPCLERYRFLKESNSQDYSVRIYESVHCVGMVAVWERL